MKAKAYVKKYNIDTTTHFDRTAFLLDFQNECQEIINAHPIIDVGHYEKIVIDIRMKWTAIFNKSILNSEQIEKFWKYFYATYIIPFRESKFENFKESKHEYRMKADPEYRRKYNNWRNYEENKRFYDDMYSSFFKDIFRNLIGDQKKNECLSIMGLSYDASSEDVKARFRAMAMLYHPDATKQDDSETFMKVVDAKNYLLKLLKKQ